MTNDVNDRVIDLLKSSGMTEVQLAEAIRKPASTVYRITRKEVKPSKPTLQLIATALNANFIWLTYGKGEPMAQPNAQQTPAEGLSWQDATYKSMQDQIATLKALVSHLSGGKLNFPNPLQKPDSTRPAHIIPIEFVREAA